MTKRQTRMAFVGVLLIGVSVATFLALRALGENMLYFYKPSELYDGDAPLNQRVRIGGLVVEGSVKRADRGLRVEFGLTDNFRTITVAYNGILPDLFREGQGIIAMGEMTAGGTFAADEVLAKHDENYMPPEVAEALKASGKLGQPHPAGRSAGRQP